MQLQADEESLGYDNGLILSIASSSTNSPVWTSRVFAPSAGLLDQAQHNSKGF
jgi:hypothetical protein